MSNESPRHEAKVAEVAEHLRKKGYRVVELHRKSPDAVAAVKGKIVAVEILGPRIRTETAKRLDYDMFDDVLIFHYSSSDAVVSPRVPPDARTCDVCDGPLKGKRHAAFGRRENLRHSVRSALARLAYEDPVFWERIRGAILESALPTSDPSPTSP